MVVVGCSQLWSRDLVRGKHNSSEGPSSSPTGSSGSHTVSRLPELAASLLQCHRAVDASWANVATRKNDNSGDQVRPANNVFISDTVAAIGCDKGTIRRARNFTTRSSCSPRHSWYVLRNSALVIRPVLAKRTAPICTRSAPRCVNPRHAPEIRRCGRAAHRHRSNWARRLRRFEASETANFGPLLQVNLSQINRPNRLGYDQDVTIESHNIVSCAALNQLRRGSDRLAKQKLHALVCRPKPRALMLRP